MTGPESPGPLAAAFDTAAARYDVPRDLLMALGYAESRLEMQAGTPSEDGGYGLTHLVRNPQVRNLDEAATLTRFSQSALRSYADQAGPTVAARCWSRFAAKGCHKQGGGLVFPVEAFCGGIHER
ncbi:MULTISPECIES: hypothetical protein [unclassified Micromonospora]|uniref:hypothetical protein n=1 Tax=unclassified Micromonospora TaxID=2617518 RepID=UPI002FF1E2E9